MNASVSVPTPAEGEPGGGASSSSGAAEGPTGAGTAVAEATTLDAKKTRAELRAASAGTERHFPATLIYFLRLAFGLFQLSMFRVDRAIVDVSNAWEMATVP